MRFGRILLISSAILAGGAPAIAQDLGAAGGANPVAGMCRADEHIDGQLAFIKAELKITEAQESQWNVFAGVFRENKERQERMCKDAQEQARALMAADLPESMKMMVTRMTEQLESLRAMEAAVQPLYAILSKEQRKKADEIMKGGQNF